MEGRNKAGEGLALLVKWSSCVVVTLRSGCFGGALCRDFRSQCLVYLQGYSDR